MAEMQLLDAYLMVELPGSPDVAADLFARAKAYGDADVLSWSNEEIKHGRHTNKPRVKLAAAVGVGQVLVRREPHRCPDRRGPPWREQQAARPRSAEIVPPSHSAPVLSAQARVKANKAAGDAWEATVVKDILPQTQDAIE